MAPPRPAGTDVAGGDPAEGGARGRADDGQIEMPDKQDERDVHEAVVQENRVGEAKAGIALAVPEQEARDGEEQCEGGGQRRVQLLAGVEPARVAWPVEEPAAIVLVEAVELAPCGEEVLAVADRDH